MVFNPIGDFEKIADGLRPVTLSPEKGDAVPGISSLRRAVTLKEAEASSGRYTTSDTVFHVSTLHYAERLSVGSHIEEASGQRWVVLEHAYQTLLARWRYVVRLVAVDCPNVIFREVAEYAKSKSGALEPTWVRDPSPIVAKFEPIEENRVVENQSSRFIGNYVGYFENEIEVTDRVRFVDVDEERIYKPIKAMGREKLGEKFSVECEVTPWPLA